MTREQALEKVATRWWETATLREIVEFQLFEDRLCMPFDKFHEAVEKELGRPVFTHEFAAPEHLRKEFSTGQPQTESFTEPLRGKKVIIVEAPR